MSRGMGRPGPHLSVDRAAPGGRRALTPQGAQALSPRTPTPINSCGTPTVSWTPGVQVGVHRAPTLLPSLSGRALAL